MSAQATTWRIQPARTDPRVAKAQRLRPRNVGSTRAETGDFIAMPKHRKSAVRRPRDLTLLHKRKVRLYMVDGRTNGSCDTRRRRLRYMARKSGDEGRRSYSNV